MAHATLVSDEVWAQLDPRAGRLSRHGRLCLIGTVVALTLCVAIAVAVRLSGLFSPRIGSWASEVTIDTHTHTAVERLHVGSSDWFGERVDAVTSRTPGVMIMGASRGTIPANGDTTLTVRMQFDCAVVAQGRVILRLWLHRPWGSTSTTVWGPDVPASDGAQGVNVFMNGPGWAACGRGD